MLIRFKLFGGFFALAVMPPAALPVAVGVK